MSDLQGCEFCSKEFDIEVMTMHGDYWVCPECDARWRGEFAKCPHEWEPHHDHMGDPGQLCRRCSRFDIFPEMFPPSTTTPSDSMREKE